MNLPTDFYTNTKYSNVPLDKVKDFFADRAYVEKEFGSLAKFEKWGNNRLSMVNDMADKLLKIYRELIPPMVMLLIHKPGRPDGEMLVQALGIHELMANKQDKQIIPFYIRRVLYDNMRPTFASGNRIISTILFSEAWMSTATLPAGVTEYEHPQMPSEDPNSVELLVANVDFFNRSYVNTYKINSAPQGRSLGEIQQIQITPSPAGLMSCILQKTAGIPMEEPPFNVTVKN
jgi:hypothetical protein